MRMEFGLWSVAAEGYDVSCWLEWSEVELIIQTSRAMDINLYICRASPMEQIVLHKGARRNPRRSEELPLLFAPSQLHLCTCCVILHVFVILHCNSLLLTIQFPDTLTPEVHSAIQKLPLSLSKSSQRSCGRLE